MVFNKENNMIYPQYYIEINKTESKIFLKKENNTVWEHKFNNVSYITDDDFCQNFLKEKCIKILSTKNPKKQQEEIEFLQAYLDGLKEADDEIREFEKSYKED